MQSNAPWEFSTKYRSHDQSNNYRTGHMTSLTRNGDRG